eukprot:3629383-Pyramimonas_sp.AAC.1
MCSPMSSRRPEGRYGGWGGQVVERVNHPVGQKLPRPPPRQTLEDGSRQAGIRTLVDFDSR